MNPILAQWLPAIFIVLAVWVGLIYNNKRLDDFRDVINKRLDDFKAGVDTRLDDFKNLMNLSIGQAKAEIKSEMQIQIMESEKRILQAIGGLRADIQNLERRVERLEAPLIRS